MKSAAWLAFVAGVGTSAAASAQMASPQQVLQTAADALGGVDAVRNASTLEIEGSGTSWWLGQGISIDDPLQIQISTFEQRRDLDRRRIRTDATMPYYGVIVQYAFAADGDVGFRIDNGKAQRINEAPAAGRPPTYETPFTLRDEVLDQALGFYHHPLPLLRAALRDEGVRINKMREDDEDYVLDMSTPAGPVMLRVGKADGLPRSVASRDYMGALGDVAIVTTFDDYASAGDLRLPGRITQSIDERASIDVQVRNAVGGDVGDLAIPDDVRNAAIPVQPPAVAGPTPLAPGVWRMAGNGAHASVLVEFPSYTVLIEAPVNDQRALAVIAEARSLVPGKPLRYLVTSHHHYDHSGGVRAAVANGLTLIAHKRSAAFYNELVKRPHIVHRDYLARHPAALKMISVDADGSYELSEGDRKLMIYPGVDSPHADDLLMAYLPNEGVLVQSDMFMPQMEDTEGAYPNLLRNIRDRRMSVKQIVSGHGEIVPFQDLEDAVAQMTPGQ